MSIHSHERTYIVQPGDTLEDIAQRFDTTVEALVRANAISEPDLIIAGQSLIIPSDDDETSDDDDSSSDGVQLLIELTNIERQKAGLRPLRTDSQLAVAAERHSRNMALEDFFSNTDPSTGRRSSPRPDNQQAAAVHSQAAAARGA